MFFNRGDKKDRETKWRISLNGGNYIMPGEDSRDTEDAKSLESLGATYTVWPGLLWKFWDCLSKSS